MDPTPEEFWANEHNPDRLLDFAKSQKLLKGRKSRLFACGCFRLAWELIRKTEVTKTVEVAEERADRKATDQDLERVRYPLVSASHAAHDLSLAAQSLAIPNPNPKYIAWQVRRGLEIGNRPDFQREAPYPPQADLLRDIFGNPFRPLTFAPEWRTAAAVGVAAAMYESREFANMPVLADALQDAGCASPEILDHCRGPGPHVRGCWVVDLLLGKS